VAFPRIRTLDSSQTPRREALAGTPRALAAVDLSAIRGGASRHGGGHVRGAGSPCPGWQ